MHLGPTEILIILGIILLLFGGKKLPELARGAGRSLRIFKTEISELKDDRDDDLEEATVEPRSVERKEIDPGPRA